MRRTVQPCRKHDARQQAYERALPMRVCSRGCGWSASVWVYKVDNSADDTKAAGLQVREAPPPLPRTPDKSRPFGLSIVPKTDSPLSAQQKSASKASRRFLINRLQTQAHGVQAAVLYFGLPLVGA